MSETLPKLSQDFRDFLIEAKSEHGYGQPKSKVQTNDSGGKRIRYKNVEFSYVDEFVGGSPFSGYETVSVRLSDRLHPVWSMAYFETFRSPEFSVEELSEVIGTVLTEPDPDLPIRGPKHWEVDDYRYKYQRVDRTGTLERFDVEEFIHKNGKRMYVARFIGGLVNRDVEVEASKPIWLADE